MKHISVFIFAVLVVNTNSIERKAVRYGLLEVLAEDLKDLEWGNEEKPCLGRFQRILKNVQNSTLWATWIWDSMQIPYGHLYGNINHYGNYDECMDFPWEQLQPDLRTQYCLTTIRLSGTKPQVKSWNLLGHDNVLDFIKTETKFGLRFNRLNWGVCVPAVCHPRSVIKFVGVLFRHTHLGLNVDEPYNITIDNCETAGVMSASKGLFCAFWCFVAFAVVMTICISLYVDFKGPAVGRSAGIQYLKAFHIQTSAQSLVKITDDDVRPVFGIRFMSSYTIVYLHTFMLFTGFGVSNGYHYEKEVEGKKLKLFNNIEMSVDTFMVLSGLFLIRSLMRNVSKPFNPLKWIVKRYFRLAWPIAVLVLMVLSTSNPIVYHNFNIEYESCKKYWWRNMLMVQNYVDPENMCYPATWSTASDFHLSVIGTLIFWAFKKNRRTGVLLYLAVLAASIVAPAVYVYNKYESPVMVGFIRFVYNYRKQAMADPIYVATHFRAGPYFVGIACGYLTSVYNPSNYRHVLSVKQSIVSFCGLLSLSIGFILSLYMMSDPVHSLLGGALYIALKRVIWAILTGILVLICEYGTLPVITNFLGWSAFAPLSRLSYGIYLSHMLLITLLINIPRTTFMYSPYYFIVTSLGITVIATIISLFLWIFFEAPMQNIVSLLLRSREKSNLQERIVTEKQNKEMNGKHL